MGQQYVASASASAERLSRVLLFLWCAPAVLWAQALCVTVSPIRTARRHDHRQLPREVRNGPLTQRMPGPDDPLGVPERLGGPVHPLCITIPVQIQGCGTTMPRTRHCGTELGSTGQVPPGLYWFEIKHAPSGFSPTTTEWHCVTITGAATDPVLSAAATGSWGVPFQLTLTAPTHPGEFYAIALSGSTNTGVALSRALPVPRPGRDLQPHVPDARPVHVRRVPGRHDRWRSRGGPPSTCRHCPFGCLPLHAQAGIVDSGSNVYLSNEIHFTIQ